MSTEILCLMATDWLTYPGKEILQFYSKSI